MLKKVGIPLLTLAGMLFLIPAKPAKAGVRFGVYLGAPAYVAPAPVYPPYVVPTPNYYDPYAYGYVAPSYVYPYANWRWGGRGYWGHDHDRDGGRGYVRGGGYARGGGYGHGGGHGRR